PRVDRRRGRDRRRRGAAGPTGASANARQRIDGRRDGGADRGQCRLPDDLRHGQGGRSRHADRGRQAGREIRRQERTLARGGTMKEPMISVAEALARVLAAARPASTEEIGLAQAFGRTLAAPVVASRTQPPFVNSAMDGYALRARDAAKPGARLRVIGESAAGRTFAGEVGEGEAARIFTGAPLPPGADAVAVQEDARRDGDFVVLDAVANSGDHVRAVGLDFRAGDALLSAGKRLTARDVALIAAASGPTATVRRRPRIAILATGDELRAPGQTLGPAQIVASNNFFVAGLAQAHGGEAIDLGIAPDRPEALAERIAAARTAQADVLVTLGGASVGDYDLVRKALIEAGM